MQEMAPSDVQAPTGTPAYDDEDDEDLARRLQLSVTDTFDSVAIIAHALNVLGPENGVSRFSLYLKRKEMIPLHQVERLFPIA
jgi:hypothetical protein